MKFNQLGKLDLGLGDAVKHLSSIRDSLRESTQQKIAMSLKLGTGIALPKIIRDHIKDNADKQDFLVGLNSIVEAYTTVCTPRLVGRIRNQSVSQQARKGGVDFATAIDYAIEKYVRDYLFQVLGKDNIQIFGEEAGEYLGSQNAKSKFRLDPVDGTVAFKSGRDDWGIMLGKYLTGEDGKEYQEWSITYYPEKEGAPLLIYIRGLGAFLVNTLNNSTGSGLSDFVKVPPIREQNDLNDMTITMWKHSDKEQRHPKIQEIESNLRDGNQNGKPAQVKITYSACADVLASIVKQGRHAFIIGGDYSEVDYIPFSAIESLGYKIYKFDGDEPLNSADVELKNQYLVVVPPGKAGLHIRNIIKETIS